MEERQLELIKISIFKIDLAGHQVSETPLLKDDEDFYNYIRGSINEVSLSTGGRKFKIRSTSTQVVSILLKNVSDIKLAFEDVIADRLLREEISVHGSLQFQGSLLKI